MYDINVKRCRLLGESVLTDVQVPSRGLETSPCT